MSISITSRAAWGARAWNGSPARVSLSQRTEFFVHWFGGVPGNPTGAALAREVERLHMNGNGWAGVGYNWIVDQDGNIFEGRGWDLQGAHCPGHNVSGFGVLIAVGKGGAKASAKALSAARGLYDEACRKTGRTLAKRGHRDGIATECPGPDLYAWVKNGMPAEKPATPKPAPKPKPKKYEPFPGAAFFKRAPRSAIVTAMGKRLVAEGCSAYVSGPGPQWTEADRKSYAKWQRKLGFTGADADGYPGKTSWDKLRVPEV
ncbi:peptidoglycan-binding protein [Streptomyces parvus]|uniref:peptidoglycan-binding protein n=1 Tax=Streptomyces parvus TaxID=66428 RepID=UPI003D726E33